MNRHGLHLGLGIHLFLCVVPLSCHDDDQNQFSIIGVGALDVTARFDDHLVGGHFWPAEKGDLKIAYSYGAESQPVAGERLKMFVTRYGHRTEFRYVMLCQDGTESHELTFGISAGTDGVATLDLTGQFCWDGGAEPLALSGNALISFSKAFPDDLIMEISLHATISSGSVYSYSGWLGLPDAIE